MTTCRVPAATYRIQFPPGFGFADALALTALREQSRDASACLRSRRDDSFLPFAQGGSKACETPSEARRSALEIH